MIGIDIVDLQDPRLNSRENALRFISHPEDDFLKNQITYWLLWAAKEAVFKAKREVKPYAPKSIPVSIYKAGNRMLFSSGDFTGELFVSPDHVVALVSTAARPTSFHVYEARTTDASTEIRSLISSCFLENKSKHIKVVKDSKGLPALDHKNIPVSIAHHHRFLAFAYPDFQ